MALIFKLVEVDTVVVPSTASKAVAPASTYARPTVVVAGLDPRIVITGGVTSGTIATL